jgi:hypothetical protein
VFALGFGALAADSADALELALEIDQAALPLRIALLGLTLELRSALELIVDRAAPLGEERRTGLRVK